MNDTVAIPLEFGTNGAGLHGFFTAFCLVASGGISRVFQDPIFSLPESFAHGFLIQTDDIIRQNGFTPFAFSLQYIIYAEFLFFTFNFEDILQEIYIFLRRFVMNS